MNRCVFALAFICTLLTVTLVMMNESRLKRENEELINKLDQIEISFVIDPQDVTWVQIKNGKRVKAISCTGDSISFMISDTDVDTVFTKITVADLMAAKR